MADPIGTTKSALANMMALRKCIREYCKIDSDLQSMLNKLDRLTREIEMFFRYAIEDPTLLYMLKSAQGEFAQATAAANAWEKRLGRPIADSTLLNPSPSAPGDPLLSEQIVECLAFGEKIRKQVSSAKSQVAEVFNLAFRKGKKWSIIQANKAIFLAEGKEELCHIIDSFESAVASLSRTYGSHMHNTSNRPPSSFDLKKHPFVATVIRAKERASSCTPIRRTIDFDQHFEHADLLSYDGCDVPIQKNGDVRLLLDRERRPDDNSIEARSRAVLASESFVRMFQLDEGEDPEKFRRSTGLLSCSALVMHHDELAWEKRFRKEWDDLLAKNPAAWKMSPDQRPPLPPSLRHSILFNLPRNMNGKPLTLRRRLDDDRLSNQKPFLINRIRFSCALAESMIVLHAMGVVHKGIRPDNILVINEGGDKECFTRQIGMPYFIGFEQVRGEVQESGMRNYFTNELRRNIYNSSDFFEQTRHRKYVMLDDIYSFGVTLIEILTWQSFFKYENGEHQDDAAWKRDECVLDINEERHNTWTDALMGKAEELKHISYTLVDIIHLCLHNGNAFKDKEAHGMSIGREEFTLSIESSLGIKFVEKVLTELRALETATSKRLDSSIF